MKIIFRIPVIIIQLLICLSAIPQQYQYINNRFDLNGLNDVDRSYNIIEVENGYIIAGNSIARSENIYWWKKVIAKIDLDGQIQTIKFYGEDSVDYFFSPFPGFMIKDDNYFYTVGKKRTFTSAGIHDEGMLMYLDENLDTLWSKKFGEQVEPYDTAYLFTCLQKLNQTELVIAGAWKPDGLPTCTYLIKTDGFGQMIWQRSYSYYGYYIDAYSVAQTSDQGFILGCFKQTPGYPELTDPVIIKTSGLGIQEWTKNLGSQYKDNKAMVCISLDSMILVGTNYADSMYTTDDSYSKINIIKVDNLGNIIWNKKYGASKPRNFLLNIKVLIDSSIIAVGSLRKYNPEPDWVGWILKTNSDGDSLWYREYYYLPGQESSNYLYDVIPTSDNGLIACGYLNPSLPDTGSTDTWVIKLDSIGCEWAGCDTTVGIQETGGQGEEGKRGNLVLWPNPTSGEIHIRLNMDDGRFNNDLELRIYDVFGRSAPIPNPSPTRGKGEASWKVDVSALPPGIYLAVVRDVQTVVAFAKFVVIR